MKSIKVFDVSGRLLLTKDNINSSATSLNVGTTNQVLFVEITTSDLDTVLRKYIN